MSPTHHDGAERQANSKNEADREQYAADGTIGTELGVDECADPDDHGNRHRQRQHDQEAGDKGAEPADHRPPSLVRTIREK